ncbi:MAG: hypothetical protein NC082_05980 [Clostridiales bacterium]|nr:hypothetical protein [Clostridiales bacterium]
MSELPHDIKDDEIRIISSGHKGNNPLPFKTQRKRRWVVTVWITAAVMCTLLVAFCIISYKSEDNQSGISTNETVESQEKIVESVPSAVETETNSSRFVAISDTLINKIPLTIFKPTYLTPILQIGTDVLNDSTVMLAVQAADVRSDNGGIVGAYVKKGELISKGQAKPGFCAIIDGIINIGVATSTPLLEQALETDGYFFRQYPLVVANQVVENKPKGKSYRKALAELDGEPVVIISKVRLSFHDFSQSLVDLGVDNAIYLVGGEEYGFAIDSEGRKIEIGRLQQNIPPNTNYIVWR